MVKKYYNIFKIPKWKLYNNYTISWPVSIFAFNNSACLSFTQALQIGTGFVYCNSGNFCFFGWIQFLQKIFPHL